MMRDEMVAILFVSAGVFAYVFLAGVMGTLRPTWKLWQAGGGDEGTLVLTLIIIGLSGGALCTICVLKFLDSVP